MSARCDRVLLYILPANDGVSTDDKLRLVAGRYMADAGLNENVAADEIVIARTDRGKPYFSNCPQLHVSPSHSGDYFVCAVAGFPVGADIQIHTGLRDETAEEKKARLQRIAKRYFTPAEAEFVREDTCERFFALWTARESYVKYTGTGIDGSFQNDCVLPDDTQQMMALDGSSAGWNALGVAFRKIRLAEPYTVCVCANKDFALDVVWLTEKSTG